MPAARWVAPPRLAEARPPAVPTMMTVEETAYLRWLGSERWDGRHDVLEVGPWLGASTLCLAEGMAERPGVDRQARLHVLDNFRWREFMRAEQGAGLGPGDSFRHLFEANLAAHADRIAVHEATLPDDPEIDRLAAAMFGATAVEPEAFGLQRFTGAMLDGPLSVVFVDGAKSWRGLVHLLVEIGDRLLPGRSVIVLQDYTSVEAFWVPMVAGALGEEALEAEHVLTHNTVSFSVGERFDPTAVSELPGTLAEVDVDEGLVWLGHGRRPLAAVADQRGLDILDLQEVVYLLARGCDDAALERFGRLAPPADSRSAERVRRTLEAATGRRVGRRRESVRRRAARLLGR